MIDILHEIRTWIEERKPFALATVIGTWGSSPRQVGSAMAVSEDMRIAGSVSGGCVENEVIEAALDVLKNNRVRVLEFGVSDDKAWSVGLSCGGTIKVFVEKHFAFSRNPVEQEIWDRLTHAIDDNDPIMLLKKLSEDEDAFNRHLLVSADGGHWGDWGALSEKAKSVALTLYHQRKSEITQIERQEVFVQVFSRKPTLLIIGGSHISIPLVKFAHELNFETVVIDPRKVFASKERFPLQPGKLIAGWPQEVLPDIDLNEDIYAVLLTHDPKIDDEALKILLRSNVAYIGALGSAKTHEKRCARLKENGFSDEEISRIHGPVGLNINASTPHEIALSIIGQVVEMKNSKK